MELPVAYVEEVPMIAEAGNADSDPLRLVQLSDANAAFSQAVRFTMAEPAYAELPFGKWARVLDGQVGRKHYTFVIDGSGQVLGFAGWALTNEVKAEAWAEGRDPLEDADCRAGDCIIFNAWIAKDRMVHRFMLQELRTMGLGRKTAYFNRHYPNGSKRIVRLPINDMVEAHINGSNRVSSNYNSSYSEESSAP